jgi:quinol monooxygenase YgiN
MIVIAGSARVKPERRDAAIAAARTMTAASEAEPGCGAYRFSVDADDPNQVFLFEEWESADALDAHFAAPHMAEFTAAIADAIESDAIFTRYEVSSAAPLFG